MGDNPDKHEMIPGKKWQGDGQGAQHPVVRQYGRQNPQTCAGKIPGGYTSNTKKAVNNLTFVTSLKEKSNLTSEQPGLIAHGMTTDE
jgi:hypothetical protein